MRNAIRASKIIIVWAISIGGAALEQYPI
jgi:hypothetical protein